MFEIEVPDNIGKADVIYYAVVNLCLSSGNTRHFANGKQFGVPYGLAICKYESESGYYLFSCDHNWVEFADTWHETIEDAKDQAEFEYPGIGDFWISK